MSPANLAFLSAVLPNRNPRLKTLSKPPLIVAVQDQWEQYEARNKERHSSERQLARHAPARDRHHQIFLTASSKQTFNTASQRFMNSIRDQYTKQSNSQITDKRLWIVEAIADDTFGTLRGVPYPPRVVVMESLDISDNPENVQKESNQVVSRWTAALNRAGKALSPIQNYAVDYAVWGGASCIDCFHRLQPDYLVACEVLNADWTDAKATPSMRKLLLSYAHEAVQSGNVLLYHVLQSVDEPTMFKTVEAYSCMEQLREHMNSLDPDFAQSAMQYRAAVNRVRQLHRCVESLHSFT